jgi:hypothetical protein
MCLPQVIKSFQNYRGVATTLYPTFVYIYNYSEFTPQFRNVIVLVIMNLQAAFHTFILYMVFDRLHHQMSSLSPVIAIKLTDTDTKLFFILQKILP